MKVEILKHQPNGVLVKDLKTGQIIKYPKQFFKRRVEMGLIEVKNARGIPLVN